MDKAPAAGRGTQDITVVWIVFVLAIIGLIVAYWYLLYKPKTEEIAVTEASILNKESTLTEYKTESAQLLNYEDQFAAVVHQWNENQHFFVNGLVYDDATGTYKRPYPRGREQEAIFATLQQIWDAASYANVFMQDMVINEKMTFYMDDEPYEIPPELRTAIGWEIIMQNRGENENPLFTAHSFSVKFFGNIAQTRRFIEILQKLEGQVAKIFSIHCFETSDSPGYRVAPVGLNEVVMTDISLEIDMYMSVHEVNPDATTANMPPDIPGTASCSYGSAGGGSGGGGGGGSTSGGGGVGLGI